jgi:hypothetical protein
VKPLAKCEKFLQTSEHGGEVSREKTLADFIRALQGDIDAIRHGQPRNTKLTCEKRRAQLQRFELELEAQQLIDRADSLRRDLK